MGVLYLGDTEKCKNRKMHLTKIFTSCFPSKRFCYFCMEEVKEDKNESK